MKSQSKRNSSTSESQNLTLSHVRKRVHRKPSLIAFLTHPSRGRVLRVRHHHRHHVRNIRRVRSNRHARSAQRRQSHRLLSDRKRLVRLHLHRHRIPERRDKLQLSRKRHPDERCLQSVFHDVEGTRRPKRQEQSRTSAYIQRGEPDNNLVCDSGACCYIKFDRE